MSRDLVPGGVLAGVRSEVPSPVVGPRGLPEDIGHGVREEFEKWGSDFHTPTWLTCEEFIEAIDRVGKCRDDASPESERYWGKDGPYIDKSWIVAKKVAKALLDVYGESMARFVIAFDN